MNEKIREKLVLTQEEAKAIVWEDTDKFEIISDDIVGKRRWVTVHNIVIKRLSDGKFFKDWYQVGSTESQDESAYEYTKPNFTEVFPVEKTVISYE